MPGARRHGRGARCAILAKIVLGHAAFLLGESGGTTMGRFRRNPLTPKTSGAVCPDPTAEPVDQGRDSSHGLLIASGIFMRLVPGSPATTLSRMRWCCPQGSMPHSPVPPRSFRASGQPVGIEGGLGRCSSLLASSSSSASNSAANNRFFASCSTDWRPSTRACRRSPQPGAARVPPARRRRTRYNCDHPPPE